MPRKLLAPLWLGLALSGLVLGLALYGVPFLHLIELKATDALFLARGPLPPAPGRVVVVTVGERSLDELGRWPWPRTRVAELVRAAAGAGAAAIGLDMGFFEPDRRFSAQALKAVMDSARAGRLLSPAEVVGRFHPDVVLARAIAEQRDKVVLGYFFHFDRQGVRHLKPEQIKARLHTLDRFAYPAVRFVGKGAQKAPLLTAIAPEPIQPVIMEAADAAGYFNVLPDSDGVTRRLPLLIKCGEGLFPALTVAVLARLLKAPLPVVTVHRDGMHGLNIGGRYIPTDPKGRMWINLRGGPGSVARVEAADLMAGRAPPGALAGKAVLIGVTATGLFDVKSTVFAPVHPGVEVQAQAIDNMLRGDFLRRPSWAALLALCAILGLGLGGAMAMGLMRPLAGGALVLALAVAWTVAVYRFFLDGYVVQLVHPLLSLAAAAGGALLWRNLTTEREKRFIRQTFAHYLHPQVINELLKKPGRVTLAGQKRELTVLFCDIRGFTALAGQMDPELVAAQLNIHLERMTQAVFGQHGVLDKFIGDAVMAFFGAPAARRDHAALACRAALDMVASLPALDETWRRMGAPSLRVGVGINTGEVVVGNLGSRLRLDYTVVGDAVNLASRLEGATRRYQPGVDIIVSSATVRAAGPGFFFRPLDLTHLRGKSRYMLIHQLLGADDGSGPPDILEPWSRAFSAYLARDFALAGRMFEDLAGRFADEPAAHLAEACRKYAAQPPPPEWESRDLSLL